MLDRYLFKAKGYDGEWVTGFLIFNEEGKAFIQNLGDSKEVDENTICQCTGLQDKEDALIYENDIVDVGAEKFVVEWDEYEGLWVLCQYGSVMYDFSDFEPSAVKVNGNKLYESES
jgi:uncharacterized phage protein (TIGR01671 family)